MSARFAASCWRGAACAPANRRRGRHRHVARHRPAGRGGRPVRRSIQQSDGRVAAEVDELRGEDDEKKFLARTGNGINQQLVASKLRWLRRHEPEALAPLATVRRL